MPFGDEPVPVTQRPLVEVSATFGSQYGRGGRPRCRDPHILEAGVQSGIAEEGSGLPRGSVSDRKTLAGTYEIRRGSGLGAH